MFSKCIPTFVFLTVFGLFSWGAAFGGYISISSSNKVQYEGGKLEFSINVTNKGDESAFNVQITCEVRGKVISSEIREELGVDESFQQTLATDITIENPGRYPAIVTVSYTDSNQYPFSAISVPTFINQEGTAPKTLGILRGDEFSSRGSTELVLKNLDNQPKKVQIRFVLPKELSSSDLNREVSLGPNSEEKIIFDMKNFSALPGSNYPVYALLEYDLNEKHYSSSAVGMVKIVKKDLIKENKNILIGVAVLLGLVFIFINVRSKFKGQSR